MTQRHLETRRPRKDRDVTWGRRCCGGVVTWSFWRRDNRRAIHMRTVALHVENVRQNIMAALRAGIITPSTRTELLAAEKAVEDAKRALDAIQHSDVSQMLPRAREVWRRLVASLGSDRRAEVREAIHELIGTASVFEEDGAVYAKVESGQIRMVAGACYVPSLTSGTRIQISRKV